MHSGPPTKSESMDPADIRRMVKLALMMTLPLLSSLQFAQSSLLEDIDGGKH